MTKKAILLLTLLAITACQTSRELSENDGNGSDRMLPSPCVCEKLDYNGKGYKWVS